MILALVTVMLIYLMVASLVALNSAFEAERSAVDAKDLAVIALVSAAWPLIGCALLAGRAYRKLC